MKAKKNNIEEIQKSFGTQAAAFDSQTYHLSKAEYQSYMIEKTKPKNTDHILEVAAGTCICGRAFAPYAAHVTCLDATPAMLAVGREEAEKAGIRNITFVKGVAEELPFLDDSFDIVLSRLAFHHFVNPEQIFAEMKELYEKNGMEFLVQEKMDIPVSLEGWMHLTHTKEQEAAEIVSLMKEDMAGKRTTGFAPYLKDNEIYFNHHWVFNMGRKK